MTPLSCGESRTSARLTSSTGVWRSLVARFVRDEEAVGSNPATPTPKQQVRGRFSKIENRPPDRLLRVVRSPRRTSAGLLGAQRPASAGTMEGSAPSADTGDG